MALFLSILFVIGSPIWPLEPNPVHGDPVVIVNISSKEFAYFENGELLLTSPVAVGKKETKTPVGLFTVTVKANQPYYRKLDIPGGDPKNPLGSRWIGFDALNTDGRIYGLHGTNRPSSIGYAVSNGCIRLPKEILEELYDHIEVGTKVYVTEENLSFMDLYERIITQ